MEKAVLPNARGARATFQETEGTGRHPEQTEHSLQEPMGGREKEEVLPLLPWATMMTGGTDRHVVAEAQ